MLEKFSWLYPNRTYGFAPPVGFWKAVARVPFLWFHLSSSIHWLASRQFLKFIFTGFKSIISRFSCWVLLSVFSGFGEALIYKHYQWWLRFGPGGTKSHWVNPLQFFLLAAKKNLKRVVPRGIKSCWVHPLHFFSGFKEIISIESSQGELRLVGLIPVNFYWVQGNTIKRFNPRGTQAHWFHTSSFIICHYTLLTY